MPTTVTIPRGVVERLDAIRKPAGLLNLGLDFVVCDALDRHLLWLEIGQPETRARFGVAGLMNYIGNLERELAQVTAWLADMTDAEGRA